MMIPAQGLSYTYTHLLRRPAGGPARPSGVQCVHSRTRNPNSMQLRKPRSRAQPPRGPPLRVWGLVDSVDFGPCGFWARKPVTERTIRLHTNRPQGGLSARGFLSPITTSGSNGFRLDILDTWPARSARRGEGLGVYVCEMAQGAGCLRGA